MVAKIGLKTLAGICRRTATSHAAGLDARTIWKRESEHGSLTNRRQFRKASAAIDRGSSLADALQLTDDYLPQLVRDMVRVGEQTGKVDEVLNRLGQYYEQLGTVRTAFLVGIAWPMIQLIMAILLIGFVIWITGFLHSGGSDLDMVGFGLSGTRGVIIYFSVVAVVFVAAFFFIRSLVQGQLSEIVMTPLMKLPVVGRWLQLMAMSRMAWSLGMSLESGMDAKSCASVALGSMQNRYFTQHAASIAASITRGESLYDTFAATEVFSQEFLDAVGVGEQTGRLAESMEVLSRQYEQQGKAGMQAMAVAGGVVIWLLVAALIVYFIFRFAFFYIGLLENAMDGNF